MKRFLLALAIFASVPAMAHGPYNHYGHHYRGGYGWGWVAPTVIGGVIGYEVARNQQPVIVQQPPVVIQQPPVYSQPVYQQNCSPWTEVRNYDGTVTVTRTCSQ